MKNFLILFLVMVFFCGCQTTPSLLKGKNKNFVEDQEAASAMKAVGGNLTGRPLSDQDIHTLSRDLRNDKETQSAVGAVTGAISTSNSPAKYCPVDGQRFSSRLKKCPQHNVDLKEVE